MSYRLNITIPAEETTELVKAAKQNNVRPQVIARQAIREYTNKRKWAELKEIGEKIARDLGIKKEEDVVRVFFP